MELLQHSPRLSPHTAVQLAERLYGVNSEATQLPSERDQNFLLTTDSGERFVLKIANALEDRSLLEAQNAMMRFLADRTTICPRVIPLLDTEETAQVQSETEPGANHFVRLVSYIPGTALGKVTPHTPALLRDLGCKLGHIDKALSDFDHPALHRDFHWDLANGPRVVQQYASLVASPHLRELVYRCDSGFAANVPVAQLRRSVIHGDANDFNVIVADSSVVGLIDFGDVVHSYTVGDLAIALAYVVLDKAEPLVVASEVVRGYHQQFPLTDDEFSVLWDMILMRLCMSICIATQQHHARPDNEYLSISQTGIAKALPLLAGIERGQAAEIFRQACIKPETAVFSDGLKTTLKRRKSLLGGNLSIAYENPLKIVRGAMQYLMDEDGTEYLDAYNNVAHVGHCHPRVVQAAQDQMAILNTNTRYLHDLILDYAELLKSTLPSPLRVCFFVNSGSEANELALRLARAHTNARNLIVLDHAYHGNTTTLIDISPYKHDGPGGKGAPSWVHKVPLPDTYRGLYGQQDPEATQKYARHVVDEIAQLSDGLSGFICESLPSVGGQIVLPDGYLAKVYEAVRAAGGVCIADEVQTGYGRVGTHFWGFEKYDVVPDIVVLGKPIGNGHPIGAVITTPEIAASFDNGMEFFSTFGGNTVSCAIGLTVLQVVLDERLQAHALEVGARLLERLQELTARHELIGDVRGSGLFIGVELVTDRNTREPATSIATAVVNRMRNERILFGTDGPSHNVLKIRPPMPFSLDDADRLIESLDEVLSGLSSTSVSRDPR